MAWILATHPDAGVRDARQAIELPGRAADLTHHQDPSVLDALAAAYAAGSDFERAAATARAAIELANEAQRAELAEAIGARLELYKRRQAFRQLLGQERPAGAEGRE